MAGRTIPQTTPDGLHTAAYWRERADEARAKAKGLRDLEARQTMLSIAETYERLARSADARAAGRNASK